MSDVAAPWVCGRCGGENPAGTRFCGHCGAPVAPAAAQSVPAQPVVPAEGEHLEERRLVTALFADVAGFGPLADRLDPEQLVDVVDPLLARLSDIVHGYGGRVDKFVGDAVLALFGAPVSHDDDAVRALSAALDMHREVERAGADVPADVGRLALHVGVNTGHGVGRMLPGSAHRDYSVLGDSVVLAQRLESVAKAGETFVGETTYRLTAHAFEFEPIGPVEVKGKRQPVQVWRLVGRRAAGAPAVPGGDRAPMVGRDDELRALHAQVDHVVGGRLAVSLLSGEPGVGKTRLTEAVRDHAEARGLRWLEARCVSYGTGLPYVPYIGLVRGVLDHAGAAVVAENERPYLAHLLGSPSPETAALAPEVFQDRLHRAVASLLGRLAAERTTALAVEDVQWMDGPSLALTADIVARCADVPLLVHLTTRPEGRDAAATAASPCPPERRLHLDVGPLTHQSVVSIIRGIAGPTLLPDFEEAIVERSGGNPFFVEELLRWGGDSSDADQLPPTVEGVLSARIDRLPPAGATTLLVASVIGRQVQTGWLRAAAEVADVDGAVAELVDRGFLEPTNGAGEGGVVTFRHALVQEVAYARLLRRQRTRLHQRVANVGEELYGAGDETIAVLARHRYLAGDTERGPEYLLRAARVARGLFANEEAIVHLRRAHELASSGADERQVATVQLALAEVLEMRGDFDEAQRLYEEARDATGDPAAWRGIASTLRKRGRQADALAVLEKAEEAVPYRAEGAAVITLERGRTLLAAGHPDEAVPALEAALERLPLDGVDAGHALLHLARSKVLRGEVDAGRDHAERALAILEAREDMAGLVVARRVLGGLYRQLGRFDEAALTLRLGVELAERIGHVEELGACLINLGRVEVDRGDLEEAIACDLRAIAEFERIDHPPGRAIGFANLSEKLLRAGRYEEAADYCRRALDLAIELDDGVRIADVLRTEAHIRLAAGDTEKAAARAEESAALFLRLQVRPDAVDALILAARAWDAAGRPDRAASARSQAASLAADGGG